MEFLINTYNYLKPGGIIMIPIITTSLILWMVVFERFLFFRSVEKNDFNIQKAKKIIAGNSVINIEDKSASDGVDDDTSIKKRVLINFLKDRTGEYKLDCSIFDMYIMREKPLINKYLSIISILSAIAPLLGLLGTVMGMIHTFEVISYFGNSNPNGMAGGISEALITTQSGLLVAIPGLFMSNYLNKKAESVEENLESFSKTLKRSFK